jgi:hypothetical protein
LEDLLGRDFWNTLFKAFGERRKEARNIIEVAVKQLFLARANLCNPVHCLRTANERKIYKSERFSNLVVPLDEMSNEMAYKKSNAVKQGLPVKTSYETQRCFPVINAKDRLEAKTTTKAGTRQRENK